MQIMHSPLERIQTALQRRNLDGLLVTQPENRRFLSGYAASDTSIAESAGVLLIPQRGIPILLTDSRYQLQAEQEAAGFEVRLYRRNMIASLQHILPSLGMRRFGFESHYLLHKTAVALTDMARKLSIQPVPVDGLIERLRIIKTAPELATIRQAVALNEAVFQEVYADLRPGQTERQVAMQIEIIMRAKGAEGPSFATIVAGGPNSALPHAVPTDRPLQQGEPIIIDMGTRLDGYCSDMTRTVVLGRPVDRVVELVRLVRRAQLAAMQSIRAGITAQAADRSAREIITRHGYGKQFGHGLGHGVGLAVHEAPSLNRRSRKQLAANMVVTVEPGIYLPGWGGVRLENMVRVRSDGCENLNRDTTFLDL
jgi:Xaa-Pro aminopeptidase